MRRSATPEPDQHAKDELERLNKSREWLKDYHKAMSQNPASNDEAKLDMPTSEAAE